MRLRGILALVLLATAVGGAPAAHASTISDLTTLLKDYSPDGSLEPCKYSKSQLQNALKNIPPDVQQYAPGFEDAVRAGLEALSRGDCNKGKQGQQGGAGPAAPGSAVPPFAPGGGVPALPGATIIKPPPGPNLIPRPSLAGVASPSREVSESIRALDPGAGAPGVVQVLGIAAVLLSLIGLMYGIARFFGWNGEHYLRPLRTAGQDAGARGSDFLADFRDWVRFGR